MATSRWILWSALVLLGCSSSDRPSPAGQGGSNGGGSGTGGGAIGGNAGNTAASGAGGLNSVGGGDGVGGVTGDETDCTNAQDDNGDTLIDCGDPMCAAACASSCAAPTTLADPSSVFGSTAGHASELDSSCRSQGASSGPEVVYKVKVAAAGLLRTRLSGASTNLTVSVRTSCESASTEKSCSLLYATTSVTLGETVYVMVDGYDATSEGTYVLGVDSGPTVCGDGNRDPTEDCDDRNTNANDGCGTTCKLESSEGTSNNTTATADSYTGSGYFGMISPAGDVDVIQVDVATDGSSITAAVGDFSDQACTLGLMDPMVEILASDGSQILASNDDRSPVDRCSAATADNVVAGTYFVRVSAGNGGRIPTFAYRLGIAVAAP